jgi:hypothetical protein
VVTEEPTAVELVDGVDTGRAARRAWSWAVFAVVTTVGASIAVSYGLVREDRIWLLGGAVVFAPVVVASAHGAASYLDENRRAGGAAAVAMLGIVFIVAILVSHPWWGARAAAAGQVLYVASNDPSAHVYLHRKPGTAELSGRRAPHPLRGGNRYRFSCAVDLADSGRWMQLSDSSYWVPANALRTANGEVVGSMLSC